MELVFFGLPASLALPVVGSAGLHTKHFCCAAMANPAATAAWHWQLPHYGPFCCPDQLCLVLLPCYCSGRAIKTVHEAGSGFKLEKSPAAVATANGVH